MTIRDFGLFSIQLTSFIFAFTVHKICTVETMGTSAESDIRWQTIQSLVAISHVHFSPNVSPDVLELNLVPEQRSPSFFSLKEAVIDISDTHLLRGDLSMLFSDQILLFWCLDVSKWRSSWWLWLELSPSVGAVIGTMWRCGTIGYH